jgi:hypothetical protein
MPTGRNRKPGNGGKASVRGAANIINGMKPESIGRTLGIGLRVAGRVAGQRLAGAQQAATHQAVASDPVAAPAPVQAPPHPPAQTDQAARKSAVRTGSVVQGLGGLLRPFRRVGGILWLEVTGVFFLLPVVVFVPTMWRTRASWAHGSDHRTFVVSAIVVVVFFYLGVTSFLRARRR